MSSTDGTKIGPIQSGPGGDHAPWAVHGSVSGVPRQQRLSQPTIAFVSHVPNGVSVDHGAVEVFAA